MPHVRVFKRVDGCVCVRADLHLKFHAFVGKRRQHFQQIRENLHSNANKRSANTTTTVKKIFRKNH